MRDRTKVLILVAILLILGFFFLVPIETESYTIPCPSSSANVSMTWHYSLSEKFVGNGVYMLSIIGPNFSAPQGLQIGYFPNHQFDNVMANFAC